MKLTPQNILETDHAHVWHPYSSSTQPTPVFPVKSASGCTLTLESGQTLIDGMSSWWCMLHGYNHPVLNKALNQQAESMSHIMFGGLTHKPAVELCQKLVEITPKGLNKVFLADSGSVSVEVALKMALQYWQARGKPHKHKFIALKQAYHGDTLGAMSVCDPVTGMHQLFNHVLPQNIFADNPQTPFGETFDESDLNSIKQHLENNSNIAAVILEPIVQGAGGMHFYAAEYLQHVRQLCDEYDVLLIADEIATGFGRTGKLFACEHAGISPDILCLGKALTGGYMTQAATLCTDKVSLQICADPSSVFMHGPTFMGNPLACAVSLASIALLEEGHWQQQISAIEKQMNQELTECRKLPSVKEVRILGAIGVVELHEPVNLNVIQPMFVEQGIWVRPFSTLVYIMPPFVISESELRQLTLGVYKVINALEYI